MFERYNRMIMEEANGDAMGGSGAGGAAAGGEGVATGAAINIADGSGAQAAGVNAGAPAATTNWLDTLPDDIKKDPSLAMFKEPAALAKSWISAQKMIGAEKVVIPGEKASDEERAAFYNKIGRPDSPEKYELKPPAGYELDETSAKSFKEFAFKAGYTSAQVNAAIAFDAERAASANANAEAARDHQIRESLLDYQKKLGGESKFKEVVDNARVAVSDLLSPEERAHFEKTKMGSDPVLIGLFAKLKGMMSEGKVRDGTGVGFGADAASIQAEIKSLEEDPKSPLWDPMHPGRQSMVDKRNKLYERLHAAQTGQF